MHVINRARLAYFLQGMPQILTVQQVHRLFAIALISTIWEACSWPAARSFATEHL